MTTSEPGRVVGMGATLAPIPCDRCGVAQHGADLYRITVLAYNRGDIWVWDLCRGCAGAHTVGVLMAAPSRPAYRPVRDRHHHHHADEEGNP